MATQSVTSSQSKAQLNDFFTTSIVGMPQKVVLGQVLRDRVLNSDQFVTVDAIQAKAWLSEPAYQNLQQALTESQRISGISFKKQFVNQFASPHGRSTALLFMLGFLTSAMISLALTYAWSRAWIQFTIFN